LQKDTALKTETNVYNGSQCAIASILLDAVVLHTIMICQNQSQ